MNYFLIVFGIVFLVISTYLYKQNNKNAAPFGIFGLIFLVTGALLKNSQVNQKIEAYNQSFYNLNSSLQNLGATLPSSTQISSIKCLEAADSTALSTLNLNIGGWLATLQKDEDSLKSAWGALPSNEQIENKSQYDGLISKVDALQSISKNDPSNPNNLLWNGMKPCLVHCTNPGLTTLPQFSTRATYSAGGNCSCPTRFFPTLDSNNNVLCQEIDYSGQVSNYTNTFNTLTNSSNQTYSTPETFKLLCNGQTCPASVPLIVEKGVNFTILDSNMAQITTFPSTPITMSLAAGTTVLLSNLYLRTSATFIPSRVIITYTFPLSNISNSAKLIFGQIIGGSNTVVLSKLSTETQQTVNIQYPTNLTANNSFMLMLSRNSGDSNPLIIKINGITLLN